MQDRQSWVSELLNELALSGPTGRESEQYLRAHKVRIGVRSQSSGARWTLGRHIDLSPRYLHGSPGAPYALSLVVHEIQHLKQGPLTALSIYGELEAWQAQFNFLLETAGGYSGVPGQAAAHSGALTAAAGMGSPCPPGCAWIDAAVCGQALSC